MLDLMGLYIAFFYVGHTNDSYNNTYPKFGRTGNAFSYFFTILFGPSLL